MEDQAEQFRQQKKWNQLLLLGAARGYDKDVVALVELGADLGFKDKKGLTALHYAAGNGRLDAVKFLWSRGAEVDAEAPDGRTPLHLASLKGHPQVITFLLQKGAWIDAEDAQDNTPLHLAASRGHVGAVETLLKHGAKPKSANKHGLSPLGAALARGHSEVAQSLLGWGAVMGKRPGGFALLHVAAGRGAVAGVKWLLDHGADVNEHDNREGSTPLHAAVMGGEPEAVELLLKAGADATIADAGGRLPADLLPTADDSKQAAQIQALLADATKKGAGPKAAAAKGGSAAKPVAAAAKSPHKAFQAFSEGERRSKVELWTTLAAPDLAAALAGYPSDVAAEAGARLGLLRAARARSNIHKAMAAAHADEEFQADAAQPHVSAAIDEIRANPSKYDQYSGNPVVVSVIGKMRRLHAVCQANDQRTVSLDDMLVKPGADYEEQDAERSAVLAAEIEAQLAAVAAAAAAQEGEAQEAAVAAYASALEAAKQRWQQRKQPGPSTDEQQQLERRPPQSAAKGKKSTSLLQQHGVKPKEEGKDQAPAQDTAAKELASAEAIRELESKGRRDGGQGAAEEEEDLPEWLKGGFSWKKVWQEFWRQTQLALLVMLGFLLLTWVVRGQPPWRGAQRGVGVGPGAGGEAGKGGPLLAGEEGAAGLYEEL